VIEVPVFRYFLVVGGALLGLIIFFGDGKQPSDVNPNKPCSTLDSLRAMAHHGESRQSMTVLRHVDDTPAPIEKVQLLDNEIQPNAAHRAATPSKAGFTLPKVSWRNANAQAVEVLPSEHRQKRKRKSRPQTAMRRASLAESYRTGSILGDRSVNSTW
jgi:hypothetical protein